jgi:hypothetical protein
MSRANNASKSGMGMWPVAYLLKSLSNASLADIVYGGDGGGEGMWEGVGGGCVRGCTHKKLS